MIQRDGDNIPVSGQGFSVISLEVNAAAAKKAAAMDPHHDRPSGAVMKMFCPDIQILAVLAGKIFPPRRQKPSPGFTSHDVRRTIAIFAGIPDTGPGCRLLRHLKSSCLCIADPEKLKRPVQKKTAQFSLFRLRNRIVLIADEFRHLLPHHQLLLSYGFHAGHISHAKLH